uniref:Uncharacterized protein n=1 Tax=Arundo donax TaxID=35708 RepID=A0A0A9BHD7_ARUDO
MSVAESVAPAGHQNDETHSFTDMNIQNPGVMVEDICDKDTGVNSGSIVIEKVENLDTSEVKMQMKEKEIILALVKCAYCMIKLGLFKGRRGCIRMKVCMWNLMKL